MEARDYFEKYGESIWMEMHGLDSAKTSLKERMFKDSFTGQMFCDFFNETLRIIDQKHARQDDAAISAVVAEQNQKWNAVVDMFIEQYGETPIKKDGYDLIMKGNY